MTEKSSWVSKVRGNTQLLIFTGSEPPRWPKCGHRDYEPAENHPNEMRCQKYAFFYTDMELVSMVSPGL